MPQLLEQLLLLLFAHVPAYQWILIYQVVESLSLLRFVEVTVVPAWGFLAAIKSLCYLFDLRRKGRSLGLRWTSLDSLRIRKSIQAIVFIFEILFFAIRLNNFGLFCFSFQKECICPIYVFVRMVLLIFFEFGLARSLPFLNGLFSIFFIWPWLHIRGSNLVDPTLAEEVIYSDLSACGIPWGSD